MIVANLARGFLGVIGRVVDAVRTGSWRGPSVALLGPDGTGKSTLSRSLAASFQMPGVVVYMGLWQGESGRMPFLPGLDLAIRVGRAWRAYLVGRYHQLRGRLVIFDRYTYDARLGLAGQGSLRGRLYYRVIAVACPPPDLVLILDVPGRVAFERKHEHSAERLESDRNAFLALASRLRNAEIVDASRSPEEVRVDVVGRLLRQFQGRLRA